MKLKNQLMSYTSNKMDLTIFDPIENLEFFWINIKRW